MQRADQRHRGDGRADQHLVAVAGIDAPVAKQRRERVGIGPHGVSSSGKCSVTCSRSESRTNLRSACDAIR